ncbi:hypothetical protein Lalb_Chr15g0083351 [Lupinus albus]|uniref:Uncharacterized protein n=1 Tax=Lupinus albus TaxID=3870 RepID=A0A6A4P988_LUPAL|nr:hypothetical protein Lalb_Chr15g0083351 [Lupinus albus]
MSYLYADNLFNEFFIHTNRCEMRLEHLTILLNNSDFNTMYELYDPSTVMFF